MPANRDYFTIGEVVEQLKPRYPNLSISKVRYYEEEKIIKPERTPGGYRKFKKEDIQRLELALRLQKEKYLPLEVIRRNLDMMDMGQIPPEVKQISKNDEQENLAPDEGPIPVEKAINSIGISVDVARMLESFGIIQTIRTNEGKCYGPIDIKLMVIARDLGKYGIEARHLRMYASLAEKEAVLFQQILNPIIRQRSDDREQRINEVLDDLCELSEQMKSLLLKKKIKESIPIK
ncbi:MAG: MerR family transcriptional regulator [Actinomycetota bacterium]